MVLSHRNVPDGRGVSRSIVLLSLFFMVAGSLHFVMPDRYQRIIPDWTPKPSLIVQLSGAAAFAYRALVPPAPEAGAAPMMAAHP